MKDLYYANLYAVYGGLLTDSQADITESYYGLDLSLSEIAAEKGVTRQAVADALKKARAQMDKFESIIGVLRLKKAIADFAQTLPEGERKGLIEILE